MAYRKVAEDINSNFFRRLYPGQDLYGFQLASSGPDLPRSGPSVMAALYGILHQRRPYVSLSSQDVRRIHLASVAMNTYGLSTSGNGQGDASLEDLGLADRIGNWPSGGDSSSYMTLSTFSAAGLCYGGLHLLAWNTAFPNATSLWFWRMSALLIASSCVLIPSWHAIGRRYDASVSAHLHKFNGLLLDLQDDQSKQNKVLMLSSWSLCMCLLLTRKMVFILWLGLYIVARAFLVVECFIDLAHLPDSAFTEVNWSSYFPHII